MLYPDIHYLVKLTLLLLNRVSNDNNNDDDYDNDVDNDDDDDDDVLSF